MSLLSSFLHDENFFDLAPLVEGLFDQGYCVISDFFPSEIIIALRDEARNLYAQSAFRRAQIGKLETKQRDETIRNDEIYWLGEHSTASFRYFALIEQIRTELNRALFLGLWEYEFHYARYPAGSFYKTHYDNFKGTNDRKVTLITYLNDNWQESDGGQLRIYQTGDDGCCVAEVLPRAGTLVCFLSEVFPHEVLPTSTRERFSVTGWFRSRPA